MAGPTDDTPAAAGSGALVEHPFAQQPGHHLAPGTDDGAEVTSEAAPQTWGRGEGGCCGWSPQGGNTPALRYDAAMRLERDCVRSTSRSRVHWGVGRSGGRGGALGRGWLLRVVPAEREHTRAPGQPAVGLSLRRSWQEFSRKRDSH
jgi:hypothetical protein